MASEINHLETCAGLIGPVFNINAPPFNAKSDGVTNDSAAVQAAEVACAAAGGGTVAFPAGKTIAGGLTLNTDCPNVGVGIGATVVQLPAGANTAVFISANFASLTGTNSVAGVFDTGLKEMSVDGNQANETGGAACIQYYGYAPVMIHVRFQYCYGIGWYSEWGNGALPPFASASMVNDVRVLNSGANGITWHGPHDAIWQNVVTYLNAGIGVEVGGAGEGLLINGFHSWGNTQTYALYLDAGIASTICDTCILEGATVSQYYVDGPFNTFTGQMYNAQGTASDMTIGGTNGAGTNIISTTINASVGQTGPLVVWGNDNGQNQINITAFCQPSTTPFSTGSQGSNDSIIYTSQNCTGGPGGTVNVNTISANSLQAHFGTNLALKANGPSSNTGSILMNNNAGANNTQGALVYDGGTTNAIHFEPLGTNGIATYQFNTSAPSASCIFGSLAMRVDTGAAPGAELYVCVNVSGTGTWYPVTQPSGSTPDNGTYNFGASGSVTFNNGFTANGPISQVYNASSACQTGAPTAEFCAIGTSTVGMALGPVGGAWATGTANSQNLDLCRVSSGTPTCASWEYTSGGVMLLGGSVNGIQSGNTTINSGTAPMRIGVLGQGANTACAGATPQTGAAGTWVCHITASAGAWSYTFGQTYLATQQPICFVSDATTAGGAKVTAYAGSSGAWTGCSGTSGTSDIVDVMVVGNYI
jgi:hypothetical protein